MRHYGEIEKSTPVIPDCVRCVTSSEGPQSGLDVTLSKRLPKAGAHRRARSYIRNDRRGTRLLMTGAMLLSLVLTDCSTSPERIAGGTTTETTNGTSAVLVNPDGQPAENVTVTVVPEDYLPSRDHDSLVLSTMTDDEGLFSITGLEPGTYVIEALNADSSLGAFISGITIGDSISEPFDSIVRLEDVALAKTGCISGTVLMSGVGNDEHVNIEIYGLSRTVDVSWGGNLFIRGLPPHTYTLRVFTDAEGFDVDSVEIRSSDTMELYGLNFLSSSGFAGMKTIGFNTTRTGADIAADITEFPLLIRLDDGSGDGLVFSNTGNPVTELCFVDDDNNSFLSYEVERWDVSSGNAELWVKVPQIDGNSSADFISLYYGSDIAGCHAADNVFDTASGFAGVWHLNEQTGLTVWDATGNEHHGTKLTEEKPSPAEGIIASGQDFNGTDAWIDLGQDRNFINNVSAVTVQAWVLLSDPGAYHGVMHISKGDAAAGKSRFFMDIDSGRVKVGGFASDTSGAALNEVLTSTVLDTGAWFHVTGIINYAADTAAVFVNGHQVPVSGEVAFSQPRTENTSSNFAALGSEDQGQSRFFHGIMDECRLIRSTRSADWIKLNYETQRPNSTFFK